MSYFLCFHQNVKTGRFRNNFRHTRFPISFPTQSPGVFSTAPPSGDQWAQANEEPVGKNQYRVKGLPLGERMLFRVTAVNIAGRSPPATLSQAVTIREVVGEQLLCVTELHLSRMM